MSKKNKSKKIKHLFIVNEEMTKEAMDKTFEELESALGKDTTILISGDVKYYKL